MRTTLKRVQIANDSRSVIINIINTFLVKGGSLVVALLTTPAYMRYFDNDSVLGIWYTILSILTWVLYFDMGIGNGLRNKLVKAIADNNIELQKKYISSAYIFLSMITVIVGVVLLLLCQFVNWNYVLNISTDDITKSALTLSVKIVLASILGQFILRLISSIMYAIQKAFVPNFLSLCTNTIVLIFILVANAAGNNNNIILLSWVYFFAVNIPLIIATILVFAFHLQEVRPSTKFFNRECAIEIFKSGSVFLILQVAGMIVGNSCVVYLITILLNSASVVEFNIYYKIYGQIYMLFSIMLTPIWSAVTKAIVENNFVWVNKLRNKMRVLIAIFFVGQFLLVPIMQVIFNVWLKDQTIEAVPLVQFVFIINNGIMMIYAFTAQMCNGLNELKCQMKWMFTATILLVPLSYIFTRVYPHYIAVIVAQTIALVPYCIFQSKWLNTYINNRS